MHCRVSANGFASCAGIFLVCLLFGCGVRDKPHGNVGWDNFDYRKSTKGIVRDNDDDYVSPNFGLCVDDITCK